MTADTEDPGLVTFHWIQRNTDREWNKIEKDRVQAYLSRKRKAVDELGSPETQLVEAFRIARRHGVDLP